MRGFKRIMRIKDENGFVHPNVFLVFNLLTVVILTAATVIILSFFHVPIVLTIVISFILFGGYLWIEEHYISLIVNQFVEILFKDCRAPKSIKEFEFKKRKSNKV